ncbi:MAG: hypothetical protein QF619_13345 [Candidatus Binatia bacterium]|nr:hypothetical protein [Candidatus Binatia bacterium]
MQTRSCGRTFLRSLSFCPQTSSLEQVRKFLWGKEKMRERDGKEGHKNTPRKEENEMDGQTFEKRA